MTFTVEMSRDAVEAGGRDRFSIDVDIWNLLVELGKAFGWKPQGTVYVRKHPAGLSETPVLHGYQPGNHKDAKYITAEDAKAWAAALVAARSSSHLEVLVANRVSDMAAGNVGSAENPSNLVPLLIAMDEFIEYAFGGAFTFARAA